MDQSNDRAPVESGQPGIQCPRCGCRHLPVLYTRQRLKKIMRIRICRHCGRRLMTYEQLHACVEPPRKR